MSVAKNATKATSIPAIERATGMSWQTWCAIFEKEQAKTLTHGSIAKLARANVPDSLANPDWWAQSIAIAFEQETGLRVPGQASDGTFRVGASRTLIGDRDSVLENWVALVGVLEDHRGHGVVNPRHSRTAQRTFWRANLEGAGKVEAASSAKDDLRATLSIEHTSLATSDEVEDWRAYWKTLLAKL